MTDRQSTYPGRVILSPVPGAENTYDLSRADVPIDAGTPLRKATLLQDSTAAALGLGTDATPDDALKALVNRITYGTAELTPGVSPLPTGTLYVVYE